MYTVQSTRISCSRTLKAKERNTHAIMIQFSLARRRHWFRFGFYNQKRRAIQRRRKTNRPKKATTNLLLTLCHSYWMLWMFGANVTNLIVNCVYAHTVSGTAKHFCVFKLLLYWCWCLIGLEYQIFFFLSSLLKRWCAPRASVWFMYIFYRVCMCTQLNKIELNGWDTGLITLLKLT